MVSTGGSTAGPFFATIPDRASTSPPKADRDSRHRSSLERNGRHHALIVEGHVPIYYRVRCRLSTHHPQKQLSSTCTHMRSGAHMKTASGRCIEWTNRPE